MSQKLTANNVYSPQEIISRLIEEVTPLDGPSCYPVRIVYDANNTVEPPTISVEVSETQSNGEETTIFNASFDQNTSLEQFYNELMRLRYVVAEILSAIEKGSSYSKERKKFSLDQLQNNLEDDFPF